MDWDNLHFWWSNDGHARNMQIDSINWRHQKAHGPSWPKTAELKNGELVNYVFCSGSKDESPSLDTDLEYLGVGRIYSIGGVLQQSANPSATPAAGDSQTTAS